MNASSSQNDFLCSSHPLQLLILQATPFCNINCRYCYLPDRSVTDRMSMEVVEAALRFVMEGDLSEKELAIVWHAGEPLAAPISFYKEAINVISNVIDQRYKVSHSVQTNATTINQKWCDFLKKNNFKVGVSLDGPEFLHDSNRITRSGKGTFDWTMRGIRLLQNSGIDFHVIIVLTLSTLSYAEELFLFLKEDVGIERIGFNIEEREGPHKESSITVHSEKAFRDFIDRFMTLVQDDESEPRLDVREFSEMEKNLNFLSENIDRKVRGQENTPFSILTVDWKGNLSTFSPELIGNTGQKYENFIFGNVLNDQLEDVLQRPNFQEVWKEVRTGIAMCKSQCQYFSVCGGGAPSNKYYENGTFASTQTLNCRYKVQLLAEQVLNQMEGSQIA